MRSTNQLPWKQGDFKSIALGSSNMSGDEGVISHSSLDDKIAGKLEQALKNNDVPAIESAIEEISSSSPVKPAADFLVHFMNNTCGYEYPDGYLLSLYNSYQPTTAITDDMKIESSSQSFHPESKEMESALFRAVKANDIPEMYRLLKQNAVMFPGLQNFPIEKFLKWFLDNTNAMMLSIEKFSYWELCKQFSPQDNPLPLVFQCVIQNKTHLLKLLLNNGVDPNAKVDLKNEEMEYLLAYHQQAREFFHRHYYKHYDHFEIQDLTPLHVATLLNQTNTIKLLLNNKADINLAKFEESINGLDVFSTPLDLQESFYNPHYDGNDENKEVNSIYLSEESLITLIMSGDNLNSQGFDGASPYLSRVVRSNYLKLLDLLSKKETFDTNRFVFLEERYSRFDKDRYQRTFNIHYKKHEQCPYSDPLTLACFLGNYPMTHLLLKLGAHPDSLMGLNDQQMREELSKSLEIKENEYWSSDKWKEQFRCRNESPLHAAIRKGHFDIVKLLVSHQANVNVRNEQGMAPIHYAAFYHRNEIIKFLIQQGADPALADNKGMTAIHYAALNGNSQAIDLLFSYLKTLIGQKDNLGRTAVDFAALGGHVETFKHVSTLTSAPINLPGLTLEDINNEKGMAQQSILYTKLLDIFNEASCLGVKEVEITEDDWHLYNEDEYLFYKKQIAINLPIDFLLNLLKATCGREPKAVLNTLNVLCNRDNKINNPTEMDNSLFNHYPHHFTQLLDTLFQFVSPALQSSIAASTSITRFLADSCSSRPNMPKNAALIQMMTCVTRFSNAIDAVKLLVAQCRYTQSNYTPCNFLFKPLNESELKYLHGHLAILQRPLQENITWCQQTLNQFHFDYETLTKLTASVGPLHNFILTQKDYCNFKMGKKALPEVLMRNVFEFLQPNISYLAVEHKEEKAKDGPYIDISHSHNLIKTSTIMESLRRQLLKAAKGEIKNHTAIHSLTEKYEKAIMKEILADDMVSKCVIERKGHELTKCMNLTDSPIGTRLFFEITPTFKENLTACAVLSKIDKRLILTGGKVRFFAALWEEINSKPQSSASPNSAVKRR